MHQLLCPTAAQACMAGTSLGRFGNPSPDIPAAIAPIDNQILVHGKVTLIHHATQSLASICPREQ